MDDKQATTVLLTQIRGELAGVEAELSRLQQKRSELSTLQNLLEARLTSEPTKPSAPAPAQTEIAGELSGKTIAEAAVAVLQAVGADGLDTRALIDRMLAGGWASTAANVYTSVFATLSRVSSKDGSEITKDGGIWRLTKQSKNSEE